MRPADAFRILEIFYLFEMAWKKKKKDLCEEWMGLCDNTRDG